MEDTNASLVLKHVAPDVAEYSANLVETFALYPSDIQWLISSY